MPLMLKLMIIRLIKNNSNIMLYMTVVIIIIYTLYTEY